MTRHASGCLESWSPVSDRIITVRLYSNYIKTTTVQVYTPTKDVEDKAKETFYDQLQKVLDAVPRHNMLLVAGDWNSEVGESQQDESGIVGNHGLNCERKDNGNFAITSTISSQGCAQVYMDLSRRSPPEPDRPCGSPVLV